MARVQYGTTWWGNEWLKALTGIDLANRIPRGKTYANTGKVFDVIRILNSIKAKVEGHYDPFYKVTLGFEPIPLKKVSALLDAIAKSPFLLVELANNRLDPSLLTICNDLGINLFPRTFHDIKMKCSCPDFAVPCKHLAALVYIVSKEIDKDPFIIFKLHGIDLIDSLKRQGVELPKEDEVKVLTAKDLLKAPKAKEKNSISREEDFECKSIEELSFSKIPNLTDSILSLLDESPAGFVHGSLKELIALSYKAAAKYQGKIINSKTVGKVDIDDYVEKYQEDGDKPCFEIDNEARTLFLRDDLNVCDAFESTLSSRQLEKLSINDEVFYRLWFLSSKLIINNAVIPQFYQSRDDGYCVRYIPAVNLPVIKQLVEDVGHTLNLKYKGFFTIDKKIDDYLLGLAILSGYLTSMISTADEDHYLDGNDGWIARLAVAKKGLHIEDKGTVRSLENYFGAFNVTFGEVKPSIRISEVTDDEIADGDYPDNIKDLVLLKLNRQSARRSQRYDNNNTLLSFGFLDEDENFIDYVKAIKKEKDSLSYMKITSLLSRFLPSIKEIVEQKLTLTYVNMYELKDVLVRSLPVLKLCGVNLVIPRSMHKLLKPKVRIKVSTKGKVKKQSFFDLGSILESRVELCIGDTSLSQEDFDYLQAHVGELVRFKDSYVSFDSNDLNALLKQKDKYEEKGIAKSRLLTAALSGVIDDDEVVVDKDLEELFENIFKTRNEAVPKTIKAKLRDYQVRGYNWMLQNTKVGIGSIIADDMGLGKTLQVITTLEKLRLEKAFEEKPGLIVVPASLIINWQHELNKFAPKLKYSVFYGPKAQLPKEGESDLIITTYGKLRSDINSFKKLSYRIIVIDEAQAIKNLDTAVRKALVKLESTSFIAMSGTPVENRLLEYYSIMDFVNKGLLGTAKGFAKEFASPIERNHDEKAIKAFGKLTAPFIMRRLKSDKSIIDDLPEKLTSNRYCDLTTEQKALYSALVDKQLEELAKADGEDFNIKRQAVILKLLTGLKQICNAPCCYAKKEDHGVELSGKGQMLIDILREQLDANRKTLVFTQFATTGELIQEWLQKEFNLKADFIQGKLSVKKRQEIVDRFQNTKESKILILSLKAAGTGLNLTAASTVIHYDLWWNPAVENQATDRAYRIGQKNNVNVVRLICANSFEEKIDAMIESKKELANLTVSVGENWISNLSNDEIKDIFRID